MRYAAVRGKVAAGAIVAAALAAMLLFLVLPALASAPGDKVPPASGQGITPNDVGIGGNGSCSNLFPHMSGVREYDNPNPQTASNLPSGHNDGVTFGLTLSGTNKAQRLAVTSSNAAILGMGINGGTDTTAYDYAGTDYGSGVALGWVTGDSNLHAPAAKYTGVDNTGTETNVTQWYGISHLTVCYRTPITTIHGNAYTDVSGAPGIAGLNVTLVDTTTNRTWTTVTSSQSGSVGNYSFPAIGGDNYTVCIQAPSFPNTETVPGASGYDCGSGKPRGYQIASLGTSQAALNFGFQPLGSVAGTVYHDLNQDGVNNDTSPQSGWTVSLYQGSTLVGSPATTGSDGSYSFANVLVPGTQYTICEQPPSDGNTWVQTEPLPSSADLCTSPNLEKGYQFTASTSLTGWPSLTGYDFGNNVAQTCTEDGTPVTGSFGSGASDTIESCKGGQTYSFAAGTVSSGTYNGSPYVSVFAGDQSGALGGKKPTTEVITLPDPNVNGEWQFTHLFYTDTFPYDPSTLEEMPLCNPDPHNRLGGVTNADNSPATSCLISVDLAVDTQTFTATIYTEIDGFKVGFG
jgi:hypothetical protein